MDFSRFIDFKKISLSDLIETLGLVLTRPWRMAEAVYKGGNSAQNALVFYAILFAVSIPIVVLPFDLGEDTATFALHHSVTAFLILGVTSVTFLAGLRLAGVPIPYHKALAIKAFMAGAYVLVLSVIMAFAAARMNAEDPAAVDALGALVMGCLPIFETGSGAPEIVAPMSSFRTYAVIAVLSFLFNLFLNAGVFSGLAPFRQYGRVRYVFFTMAIIALDTYLTAEWAKRNLYIESDFCTTARLTAGFDEPAADATSR